jgi:hypothetical protein
MLKPCCGCRLSNRQPQSQLQPKTENFGCQNIQEQSIIDQSIYQMKALGELIPKIYGSRVYD